MYAVFWPHMPIVLFLNNYIIPPCIYMIPINVDLTQKCHKRSRLIQNWLWLLWWLFQLQFVLFRNGQSYWQEVITITCLVDGFKLIRTE